MRPQTHNNPKLPITNFAFDMAAHTQAAEAMRLESLEPRLLMATDSGIVLWDATGGGNGHSYQVIAVDGGISWDDARLAAQAAGGHLATINSAEENTFIAQLIDDLDYWFQLPTLGLHSWGPWIGAQRDPAAGNAAQGWSWITGEDFDVTNWVPGAPDRVNENFAHYMVSGAFRGDTWNNWEGDSGRFPIISYVIEYDAVAEPDPNNAPTITSTPDTDQAYDTRQFEYVLRANDADGDSLTFTAVDLPDWLTMIDHGDGTATISGTPQYADIASYSITVTVSDGEDTAEQVFTVNVNSVGEISGTLWEDTDGDGVRDADEDLLVGWDVFLDANDNGLMDDGEVATVTDADGRYVFTGVQPGDHHVRVLEKNTDVDLSEYHLRHNRWWRRGINVALDNADYFERTEIDANTFLIGYERGNDDAHDDLVMQFTRGDNGDLNMEVVSRTRPGMFHLYDADGNRLARHLGWRHMRRGRSIRLQSGWTYTTPESGVHHITTTIGDQITSLDFALYQPEDSGNRQGGGYHYGWGWGRFLRILNDFLKHHYG